MGELISLAVERQKRINPVARRVEDYWCALAGGGVPARRLLRPRELGADLSHIALLERISPSHARIRVAGTLYSDAMGMEVKGMPFSALFEPDAREELRQITSTVFDLPGRGHLTLGARAGIGRPQLDAQMFLLPLDGENATPDAILAVLSLSKTALGRTPRRFTIPESFVRRVGAASGASKP
ncbi:MAG: PAS domain-containing protein [Rhodobacteraceae bacterium]|nr:PAS domain-containing protein [Paracoccaceae bacterium]